MDRSSAGLQLALACELGDEAVFQALLASRPNLVETLAGDDRRKLAHAAQSNHTQAVRLMLAAGWSPDVRGQHGGTPLHWTAWHGNAEMVREILRYRPPLELGAGEGYDGTPLGWALHGSEHGWHRETGDYAGAVEALLQSGAQSPQWTEDLAASESVREVLRRKAGKG